MTLLRRHGLWLIIAALAGIAGAWLFSAAQSHSYLSTAQIDVESNPTLGTPVPPNMATEQQVATSGVIVSRTAAALRVPTASISGHLTASASSTATVLSIGCTMPTPAAAQKCANAASIAYVGFRNRPAGDKTQLAHNPLHVTLVTSATLPHSLAGPGGRILLPIGAVLGLALGVGAIVIRDHFDDRIRDREDLERWLEGPVLAEIPRVRHRAVSPASVFRRAPRSKAAEAYRYLRFRLMPIIGPTSGGGRILLVASPQGLEGRTCVAANLASALAQAGISVLLVDADLRQPRRSWAQRSHPSLSEAFRAGDKPGLSELIAGTASLDEVAFRADMPEDTPVPLGVRLRFVGAGDFASQPTDIIEGTELTAALMNMRAMADVVVLDSAPVLAAAYVMSLARASDIAVLVADLRRTSRGDVSAAAQEIRTSGTQSVVGVVNRGPGLADTWVSAGFDYERARHVPLGGSLEPEGIMAGGEHDQRSVHLGVTATGPYGNGDIGADGDDPRAS